jgi:hypothetical protein
MEIRLYKHVYLTPFIRLNLYTKGFSLSFGHARIGWLTLGRRGIRGTLDTGVPGAYLTESRTWGEFKNRRKS